MAPTPRDRLRVALASDQSLIAQAVRVALAGNGCDVVVIAWPGPETSVPSPRSPGRPPVVDAGLVMSDLDRWSRVHAAAAVVGRIPVPWLALTTAPRGPLWGAMFAAGASQVLPSSTGLDHTVEAIRGLVRGESGISAPERAELEQMWHVRRAEHEEAAARLALLTPREQDVLRLLNGGEPVVRIAALFGIAPATVRSQVKSILRKMEVNTQLAAVVAFRDAVDVMTVPRKSAAEP